MNNEERNTKGRRPRACSILHKCITSRYLLIGRHSNRCTCPHNGGDASRSRVCSRGISCSEWDVHICRRRSFRSRCKRSPASRCTSRSKSLCSLRNKGRMFCSSHCNLAIIKIVLNMRSVSYTLKVMRIKYKTNVLSLSTWYTIIIWNVISVTLSLPMHANIKIILCTKMTFIYKL